jgi:hypothetical protein
MSVTPFVAELQDPETGKISYVEAQPRQHADGVYEFLRDPATLTASPE